MARNPHPTKPKQKKLAKEESKVSTPAQTEPMRFPKKTLRQRLTGAVGPWLPNKRTVADVVLGALLLGIAAYGIKSSTDNNDRFAALEQTVVEKAEVIEALTEQLADMTVVANLHEAMVKKLSSEKKADPQPQPSPVARKVVRRVSKPKPAQTSIGFFP
jgi:uncharacterized coiled-coil protein SlyX